MITQNMIKIAHVTHTHVQTDSRITKQLDLLQRYDDFRLHAIGKGVKNTPKVNSLYKNIEIHLTSKKVKKLLGAFANLLMLGEYFWKIRKILRKERFDIVHCHDVLALFVVVAFNKYKSVIVYDAHELESDINMQSRLRKTIVHIIEKWLWNDVRLFITVSPSIQEWYLNKYGKKNSQVIYNTPIFDVCDTKQHQSLRAKFNIHEKSEVFVYVGGLESGRGIEQILSVFTTSDNRHKHIVFLGYGTLERSLKAAAKEYPNIHIHERVKHSEVVRLISDADVGICLLENVSLSDYLALPNKLFEYAFAGLKIIGSDFPEIRRFLESTKGGIVCAPDEESLRGAVRSISSYVRKTGAGQLDEYSWQIQELKLLECYENIKNDILKITK